MHGARVAAVMLATVGCFSRRGFEEPIPPDLVVCAETDATDGSRCALSDGGTGICVAAAGGCVPSTCSDGFVDDRAGEECDDGNDLSGDGCSVTCLVEQMAIQCPLDGTLDGNRCSLAGGGAGVCVGARGGCVQSSCGDGFVDRLALEECDDDNTVTEVCAYGQVSCTVCAADCTEQAGTTSYCGDGLIDAEHSEVCDDRNTASGDGCTPACTVEAGWACDTGEPSGCTLGAMVTIDAAGRTFTMGSSVGEEGRETDEVERQVTFTRDFCISSTEVTQAEFRSLMDDWNPSSFGPCDDCPVETVSWYDVVAYMNELTLQEGGTPCYELSNVVCADATGVGASYMDCMNDARGGIESATVVLNGVTSVYECTGFRLPTEAEWEYAARGGTTTATYRGDLDAGHLECESGNTVAEPIAWFCGNAGDITHVKGTRTPNAWGLYDMLGNVWEMCWDWYDDYVAGPITDPEGPATGSYRVHRGGSWRYGARCARAAFRYSTDPSGRYYGLGTRVARSMP